MTFSFPHTRRSFQAGDLIAYKWPTTMKILGEVETDDDQIKTRLFLILSIEPELKGYEELVYSALLLNDKGEVTEHSLFFPSDWVLVEL